MVNAEDALFLYDSLLGEGIQIWLTGGWGINALLGEQTRSHQDLDAILLLKDFRRMSEIMNSLGYFLKEIWSENRWVTDDNGKLTATAFVLHDALGREFDAHAIWIDELGNGIPAWEDDEGLTFKPEDLAGKGSIMGQPVKCISAGMQIICHTGYPLPEKQIRDVEHLQHRFGVDPPPVFVPDGKNPEK